MTSSAPADNPALIPTMPPTAPAAPAPDLDLSAVLAGAAGNLPAPPDLPHRVGRYNDALGLARSIAAGSARVYVPEIREMHDMITAAVGDPAVFAPGGALYENTLALEIHEAVYRIVTDGQAAATAAAAAGAPR